MNYWTDLYKEIAEKITNNIPAVRWCDLWHEQVSYLTTEYPFPAPATFLAFSTVKTEDIGLLLQDVDTQMDVYLFYETFADTFHESYSQTDALDFLDTLNKIHALFHGRNGVNYHTMRRVDMRRVDSGGSGNMYRISFQFLVSDNSAKVIWNEGGFTDVTPVNTEITPPNTDDNNLYHPE